MTCNPLSQIPRNGRRSLYAVRSIVVRICYLRVRGQRDRLPRFKVLQATLLMFMNDSLWYRTLLMDKTDMFSAFVVYLDHKMKSLDHLQKTLMHLEVRLGDCSHRCFCHFFTSFQFAFRLSTLVSVKENVLKKDTAKYLDELTPSTWSTLRHVR